MAGEAELGFRLVRVEKGDIRNAVRDDLDLFGRHAINGPQQLAPLLRHDDELSPKRR